MLTRRYKYVLNLKIRTLAYLGGAKLRETLGRLRLPAGNVREALDDVSALLGVGHLDELGSGREVLALDVVASVLLQVIAVEPGRNTNYDKLTLRGDGFM